MALHRLTADDPSLTISYLPSSPGLDSPGPSSSSIAVYPSHLHEQYAAVFSWLFFLFFTSLSSLDIPLIESRRSVYYTRSEARRIFLLSLGPHPTIIPFIQQ